MVIRNLENFLLSTIGLNSSSIGRVVIERSIDRRMKELGHETLETYYNLLVSSESEQQALIEELVVSESWFMREPEGLAALKARAIEPRKNSILPFRILCLPCARGEEPYSVAITLLECGLKATDFEVTGCDISSRAITSARAGRYFDYSFRGCSRDFRERYFSGSSKSGYLINSLIKGTVDFDCINAFDSKIFSLGKFDVIFCRNLLIYLGQNEQIELLTRLSQLLNEDGILITAAAESLIVPPGQLTRQAYGISCAFQKGSLGNTVKTVKPRKKTLSLPESRVPRRRNDLKSSVVFPTKTPMNIEEISALADMKEFSKARAACEEQLRHDPTNPEYYYILGVIAESEGDEQSAREYYRRTLYLSPTHEGALLCLSILNKRRGKQSKSSKRLEGRL